MVKQIITLVWAALLPQLVMSQSQWWQVASPTNADLYSVNMGSELAISGGTPTTIMIRQGSWKLLNIPYDEGQLTAIATPDNQTILSVGIHRVVGGAGVFVATFDGGASWTIDTTVGVDLFDIVCPSSLICYRSGEAGLVQRSVDGGRTWTNVSISTDQDIYALYFVDDTTGWAVGTVDTQAVIFHTIDGGQTWTRQFSGVNTALFDVFCTNAQHCWASGAGGVILHTADSGNTWVLQNTGITTSINALYFVTTTHGWAVGSGGTILRTTDAGNTWTPQTSPVTNDLFGLFMIDTTSGWAVGGTGTILYYGPDTPAWTTSPIVSDYNITVIQDDKAITILNKGFANPVTISIYSLSGQLLYTRECEAQMCVVSKKAFSFSPIVFLTVNSKSQVIRKIPVLVSSDY